MDSIVTMIIKTAIQKAHPPSLGSGGRRFWGYVLRKPGILPLSKPLVIIVNDVHVCQVLQGLMNIQADCKILSNPVDKPV